ncbi:DUF1818 family protein [Synechococcus sp. CS-1325]|uniref:DUF1818 family protein n=1 Tax=unclassified Synechococcus TaxID=2626047 RepID=UPI000DB67FF1|nr:MULTISPECIES: DUF1818 family protein [unclassified Synechococcus]PZV01186.1 MAG: DUF1818 domain-containing protein [Cyanobium sp.]MCT0200713.1 DUF1818 family protein [Synechococcus sp. CS-1325]MCT0212288.1 DUF1818 family protein [Synechococcus sp. CS-1326]MCT0230617.1 DUF1818 family protein [Synechococcus sp. CS-1324]MCT0234299.1 DUF1818 family protein [Synechococcus sp. CS-1327]
MNPGAWSREGDGWRLAWEPARQPFSVLIGGVGWAAELTTAEALALRQAIRDLVKQWGELTDQLLDEELISLELERQPWWVGLEGDRTTWALHFVLSTGPSQRGIEGSWTLAAGAHGLRAMEQLPL